LNALELKVPPVAVVVIAAAGMWAVSQVSSGLHFSFPGAAWLSAGIAVVGIVIAILGVTEFRGAGTTVDPRVPEQSDSLVTSGVYRHSRNPMYAGMLLVLAGWGLFLGNFLSLLFVPAFFLYMNRFQIIPEERFMRASFGQSYSEYSSRVRRWV